ncbi:Nif3-like dinuclear metal center hexameric protein, partial [Thiolapillus sp.]
MSLCGARMLKNRCFSTSCQHGSFATGAAMPALREIIDHCDSLLEIAGVEDYCPNGLQVEAGEEVRRIVTGVTASLALI